MEWARRLLSRSADEAKKKKKKRKNKRAKHLSTPTLNGWTDRTEEVEEGELKWASLSLARGDVQGRKDGWNKNGPGSDNK